MSNEPESPRAAQPAPKRYPRSERHARALCIFSDPCPPSLDNTPEKRHTTGPGNAQDRQPTKKQQPYFFNPKNSPPKYFRQAEYSIGFPDSNHPRRAVDNRRRACRQSPCQRDITPPLHCTPQPPGHTRSPRSKACRAEPARGHRKNRPPGGSQSGLPIVTSNCRPNKAKPSVAGFRNSILYSSKLSE